MNEWFSLSDPGEIDSPALLLYPDHIRQNIDILKSFVQDTSRLRPHVKTHKSGDVSTMLIRAGISKFKCATIAEAEMLATAGAADVLLAYQPVGPKGNRLRLLSEKFPATTFSCLIDTIEVAAHLSDVFSTAGAQLRVWIDVNIGMNRTGIDPARAEELYDACQGLRGIQIVGIHAYDGHLRDADLAERTLKCNEGFLPIPPLAATLRKKHHGDFTVVAGGTPTFPIHAKRPDVECSPGTFIYWDLNYRATLQEQPFLFGALVLTRVISKPTADTLCLDLGHKSIASENPIDKRVAFLNAPDLKPVSHSEEHMVVSTNAGNNWKVGDVLYGVPYHVCPTCALYDLATVVENNEVVTKWNILSRKRMITV